MVRILPLIKNEWSSAPLIAVSRKAETGYRRTGHIKAAAYFAKLSD
jgi:hypothetical protein